MKKIKMTQISTWAVTTLVSACLFVIRAHATQTPNPGQKCQLIHSGYYNSSGLTDMKQTCKCEPGDVTGERYSCHTEKSDCKQCNAAGSRDSCTYDDEATCTHHNYDWFGCIQSGVTPECPSSVDSSWVEDHDNPQGTCSS